MLRIVWDACSTVCRTASAKLSEDRPDSSMNFTTDIVPSLIVRAGYGLPETAGMQLGAGVVRAQRHLRMVGSARKSPVTEGGAQGSSRLARRERGRAGQRTNACRHSGVPEGTYLKRGTAGLRQCTQGRVKVFA